VLHGPNVMAGYYNAPAANAEVFDRGWLRTGDIGIVDEEGYAFILDRKKDVIIRGGQNIYPADIEEVLYQFPGVAEVAVVGMPDASLGEVPLAFVAASPDVSLSASALLVHCEAHLARYKRPAEVRFLPELPKGPTGKILRRALRDIGQ
jgi:long-chain acyl-CoA synthetase